VIGGWCVGLGVVMGLLWSGFVVCGCVLVCVIVGWGVMFGGW